MTRTTPSLIFDAIKTSFDANGWGFHAVDGHEVVEADFEAHHTRVPLHVQAFPELNAVSVVARALVTTAHTHAPVICELLMRTNEQLSVGNFEYSFANGTTLFRATNLFPHGHVEPAIIAGLVHSSVAEMDRITPFLTLVNREDATALASLDVPKLLEREDLIPPPPISDST